MALTHMRGRYLFLCTWVFLGPSTRKIVSAPRFLCIIVSLRPRHRIQCNFAMHIHIGKEIEDELRRQERSVTWLARKINCDRTNIYRIFRNQVIDTNLLLRISQVLNRNFFALYFKDCDNYTTKPQPFTQHLSRRSFVNKVYICNIKFDVLLGTLNQ